MAGKMKSQSNLLNLSLGFLLCIGLITGCAQSSEESKADSDTIAKTPTVAEIYENCGDIIFAALYHLPVTHQFFESPDELIGQPAYYYSEYLDQETKDNLLIQLNRLYRQLNSSDELFILDRQLTQWCEAHQTIQTIERQYGYEEFLAGIYDSDRFEYLFSNHQNSPLFQSDDYSSFDKVASLSSAQGQQVISTLITDLARQRTQQFEEDLKTLRALFPS